MSKHVHALSITHDRDTSALLHQIGTNGQRFVQHLEQMISLCSTHPLWCERKGRLSPFINQCTHLKTMTLFFNPKKATLALPLEDCHSVCKFRGINLNLLRCEKEAWVSEGRVSEMA